MNQAKVILVVDDDSIISNQVSEVLQQAGFKTLAATTGLEGLKELNSSAIDMVILDINMPELDGVQTCRMIRANEKYQDLPVLMLTARGEIKDMLQARKIGVDDYLVKPVDPDTLLKKVERFFSR